MHDMQTVFIYSSHQEFPKSVLHANLLHLGALVVEEVRVSPHGELSNQPTPDATQGSALPQVSGLARTTRHQAAVHMSLGTALVSHLHRVLVPAARLLAGGGRAADYPTNAGAKSVADTPSPPSSEQRVIEADVMKLRPDTCQTERANSVSLAVAKQDPELRQLRRHGRRSSSPPPELAGRKQRSRQHSKIRHIRDKLFVVIVNVYERDVTNPTPGVNGDNCPRL
ncbi:hypothetical protein OE88DRAFT_1643005 [Heliocybe sulcata]|uniref:Uncharacterized protein n=1 Tax=Heliocybe sulcata TaxID=5364 RepID=A0A5C3NB66_9AGAM|nr:hypothetical protein OE88DRAFT_1643005 [Heliocybe sulcata]